MSKKSKDIRKIIDFNGYTKDIINSFYDAMTPNEDVNKAIKASLMETMGDDRLSEMLAEVYDKHFTHKEIKSMIEFYESEVGQKLMVKTPVLMQEFSERGRAWGEEIITHIDSRLPDIMQRVSMEQLSASTGGEEENPLTTEEENPLTTIDANNGSVAAQKFLDGQKERKDMVEARRIFVLDYIKNKQWGDPGTLSITQIMEIRSQEAWKNPVIG